MIEIKKTFSAFTLIGLLFLTGCATQGEVFTIDDRVAALERRQGQVQGEVESLKSSVGAFSEDQQNDEQSLRGQVANLRLAIDELRRDMQELNGRIEEKNYVWGQKMSALEETDRNRQTEAKRVDTAIADLTDQVARIQQYLNFEASAGSAGTTRPTEEKPSAATGSGDRSDGGESAVTEESLYASAKKAFDNGELERARKAFQEMIKRYPKSERADNAQFWIGESYYREKWYEKAILEYQQVVERYPAGNKVTAALLKQGFAFVNLNDAANARLILKELVKKYPDSNEAAIARKKLENLN